jgi:hypothetical protein
MMYDEHDESVLQYIINKMIRYKLKVKNHDEDRPYKIYERFEELIWNDMPRLGMMVQNSRQCHDST